MIPTGPVGMIPSRASSSVEIGLKLRRISTPPPTGTDTPFRCACADWRQSHYDLTPISGKYLHLENSMTGQRGYVFRLSIASACQGNVNAAEEPGAGTALERTAFLSRPRLHEGAALPYLEYVRRLFCGGAYCQDAAKREKDN